MLCNSFNILPALKYIMSHNTGKEINTLAKSMNQSALKSASSISQTLIKASKFHKIIKEIFKIIFHIKKRQEIFLPSIVKDEFLRKFLFHLCEF